MKSVKENLNSLLLIGVFVLPYLIYAKSQLSIKSYIDTLLVLLYIIVAIFLNKSLFKKRFTDAFVFMSLFSLFGIINMIFNSYLRVYNVIAPIAAYIGYVYISTKKLSSIPFIGLMIFNYIYFYITYFSLNPFNFFLPELNTDSFVNTSSNLIPAILIINLYIFDILNYVKFDRTQNKTILIFAFINVILILIQKSRAGIIVSVVFLFIKLFQENRRLAIFAMLFVLFLLIRFYSIIFEFSELAGDLSYEAYNEDVRMENINVFFGEMSSIKNIFFGYGVKFENMTNAVTQNLAITIWNYYGILILIQVLLLIASRFFQNKYLPISFYSVFILYSAFEGFFLSNYWDFIIYTLFFFKVFNNKKNLELKNTPQLVNKIDYSDHKKLIF